jgi:hypothetical protein
MRRLFAVTLSLLSLAAQADPPARKFLTQAADAAEDALEGARASGHRCRESVAQPLDSLVDRIDGLRQGARDEVIFGLKNEVTTLSTTASLSNCAPRVTEGLYRTSEALENARGALYRPNDDRDRRRRRRDGDDSQTGWRGAQLSALQVTPNDRFEGEPAVKLSVPQLTLVGLQGQTFSMGARFRSYEGHWSEWVTTDQWNVPQDPYVWNNAFNHYFRYSTLAEDDFSDGRYVAQVAVFDGQGQQLASREVTFKVNVPRLPPPMPVAPPAPPPVTVGAQRDCGIANDPGCMATRDGRYPMDGAMFGGFVNALRAEGNETMRGNMAMAELHRSYVTAAQFGVVLEQFFNETLRLEVAQKGLFHVVNPADAMNFGHHFRNPMYVAQYNQLIAAQLGGQVPQPAYQQPGPPQPGYPAPQPGYPQPGYGSAVQRDCGTGQDPGCATPRHGQYAMDASAFQGFIQALQANRNDFSQLEVVRSLASANWLTAAQLGVVLDQFENELIRLDAAKAAAPHVVDPPHAYGLAAKFRNTFTAQEFTQLMASQR